MKADLNPHTAFSREHRALREGTPESLRAQVATVVVDRATVLSDLFYRSMFGEAEAAPLLDHQVVNTRLRAAMRRWLVELFDDRADSATLARSQVHTGEVHARIGVPLHLISLGSRVLVRAIADELVQTPLSRAELIQAVSFVHELFALAIDAMTTAYESSASRLARSEEAYRLFFIGQDMKAERERRRSELLEWAQQLLQRYYWDSQPVVPAGEPHSQFVLWLDHKASILFEGAPEVDLIQVEVAQIETDLLPRLESVRANHDDARAVVTAINERIGSIKTLLGSMFDRYLAIEDGRDPVTALLNRRYFPAIARREIEVAQSRHSSFAVIMARLDGSGLNSVQPGSEAFNGQLAQVARDLQEHVRAGDFVFRIGDLDFLLLLVETTAEEASRVAEALRRRIQSPAPRQGTSGALTLSAGVAGFDGHPDYQRLLDRVDAALRAAQSEGGNRCVVAP